MYLCLSSRTSPYSMLLDRTVQPSKSSSELPKVKPTMSSWSPVPSSHAMAIRAHDTMRSKADRSTLWDSRISAMSTTSSSRISSQRNIRNQWSRASWAWSQRTSRRLSKHSSLEGRQVLSRSISRVRMSSGKHRSDTTSQILVRSSKRSANTRRILPSVSSCLRILTSLTMKGWRQYSVTSQSTSLPVWTPWGIRSSSMEWLIDLSSSQKVDSVDSGERWSSQ